MNKLITNLTSSVLDLSAIKDTNGNPVTLRPKDMPGCSREVSAEAARHDAVERCIEMKWASVTLIAAATAPAPPAPPAVETKTEEPAVETKTEEPAVETKTEEPVVETKTEEPAATDTPAETKVEETSHRDRSHRRNR